MLSLSGHKLHGPKGIGALYLRKGTKFSPLHSRWTAGAPAARRHRECAGDRRIGKSRRTGAAHLQDERTRVRALRDRLERGILQLGYCSVLGDIENRLPNTSNIAFEHLEGEAILHHLNRAGIAASLGSACASGSMEPSHVLRAMNVPQTALRGAIRFSLSRDNTIDDVVSVLNLLPEIIARVRASVALVAGARAHPAEPIPANGADVMKIMIRRLRRRGFRSMCRRRISRSRSWSRNAKSLWGGWIRIANGWILDLPEMAADTRLPITINARKRGGESEEQ